jgi:hypothetical protein
VGCRDVTNVPAQALYLLNDKRITDLARKWAEQILADSSLATDDDRLQRMFISAIGRSASPDELSRTRQLLMSTQQETADSASPDPSLAGWTEVGRAIFLLKEFIYLR